MVEPCGVTVIPTNCWLRAQLDRLSNTTAVTRRTATLNHLRFMNHSWIKQPGEYARGGGMGQFRPKVDQKAIAAGDPGSAFYRLGHDFGKVLHIVLRCVERAHPAHDTFLFDPHIKKVVL